MSVVTKVDFVAVPSTDWKRSRAFYIDTLGLRPDATGDAEFWIADTCFGIYEPTTFGLEFAPRSVGDTVDTGVCHMAFFEDPDGNALMLHHRYTPREEGSSS